MRDEIKIVLVDTETAACWLDHSKYRGQRKVMPSVVSRYTAEMQRGEWGLSESAIVIGVRPSGEHLLNGQHRLSAVVESKTTQSFAVHLRQFDSDHDMDMAYALMDRHSKRSNGSVLHALELGDCLGVPEGTLRAADAALRVAASDFNINKISAATLSSPQAKQKLLTDWATPIYAYHNSIVGAPKSVQRWFLRAAVMSVGIVTFKYAPDQASQFWHRVAQNDGLIKDSAEHRLYTFLATNEARTKDGNAYSRMVANAWNAFYEDRAITQLKAYQTSNGLIIKGTPWIRNANIDALKLIAGE